MQTMKLPSQLLPQDEIDRINRMFDSPKQKKLKESNCYVKALALMCPVISKHFYNVRTTEVDPSYVKHDQSFMGYRPTVSSRFPDAAPMIFHTLTIGLGAENDLQLDQFGNCNYISPKHAVIFYNDITQQYELLNYSCYGTYINNTMYRNNDMLKETSMIAPKTRRPKKYKISRSRKHAIDIKLTAIDRLTRMKCSCTPNSFDGIYTVWEGSIIVHHGSLLRFGCICFVFSILNSNIDMMH